MGSNGVPGHEEWFSELRNQATTADAHAARLVFARVKGYPAWPAQILTKEAAQVHLGTVSHKSRTDVPVIFFGTSEIAWVAVKDVVPWAEGTEQQLHQKGKKNKRFVVALEQVRDFLSLSGARRAPAGWWCSPPKRGAAPKGEGREAPGRQKPKGKGKAALKEKAAAPQRRERGSSAGGGSGGGARSRRAAKDDDEDNGVDGGDGGGGGGGDIEGAHSGSEDQEEQNQEGTGAVAGDDDSDFESEAERGGRRRRAGAGARHGAHDRQQRRAGKGRSSSGGRAHSRRGGAKGQAAEEGRSEGEGEQEWQQDAMAAEPMSEDADAVQIAAAAIAEMAVLPPAEAAACEAATPAPAREAPDAKAPVGDPSGGAQMNGGDAAASETDATPEPDAGAEALATLAGPSGGSGGSGSSGRACSWLDRYGSGALDGPSKGLRNSASARRAVKQQHAAARAQEEELRRYVAAQAAEAACDTDGWAHAYDLEEEIAIEDPEEENEFDEEEDFIAAEAATAAAAAAYPTAAAPAQPAGGSWTHTVRLPGALEEEVGAEAEPLAGRWRAGLASAGAAEADAPLAPYYAAMFASMAGAAGAVAAAPGAAAVEEVSGLGPLQQQQLRSLVLRQRRHGERPVAGALASVAAAFPGCCSGRLNAVSGRQAAVAAALGALEVSFGGPWHGHFHGRGPRQAPLSLLLQQHPSAAAAAPRRRAGGAAAAPLLRTVAGPGVPAHLLADGPTVRVGDRDGPKFEMVRRNVYVSKERPKRMAKDDVSVCCCTAEAAQGPGGGEERVAAGCGSECLNRVLKIHCDPRTCPCGPHCGNKPFHMLEAQAMEVFLTTNNRGHGVRATRRIAKGEFVVEYAGEVIDAAEMQRRMEQQRAAGQHHFYIMELGPGLFIDALRRGNYARLLNSSCEPNCETQKWYDAATGERRVGIFASREIQPGEELTYDYMFEHAGVSALAQGFRCMCGAPKCRGTMDVNPERRRDYLRRVEVFWEGDSAWYTGTVTSYSVTSRKHAVLYDDGEIERLHLDQVPHRWLDGDDAGVLYGPPAATPPGEMPPLPPPPLAALAATAAAAAAAAEAAPAPVPAPRQRARGAGGRAPEDSGDSGSWSQTEGEEGGAGDARAAAAAAAAAAGALSALHYLENGRPADAGRPPAGKRARNGGRRQRPRGGARRWGGGYDDDDWCEEDEEAAEGDSPRGYGGRRQEEDEEDAATAALMWLQAAGGRRGGGSGNGGQAAAKRRRVDGRYQHQQVALHHGGGGSSISTQSGLGDNAMLAAAMQQLAHNGGGAAAAAAGDTSSRLASLALLAAHEDQRSAAAAAARAAAGCRGPTVGGRWHSGDGEHLLPIHQLLVGIRTVRNEGPPLFFRSRPLPAVAAAALAPPGGAYSSGPFRGLLDRVAALGGAAGLPGAGAAPASAGGAPPLFRAMAGHEAQDWQGERQRRQEQQREQQQQKQQQQEQEGSGNGWEQQPFSHLEQERQQEQPRPEEQEQAQAEHRQQQQQQQAQQQQQQHDQPLFSRMDLLEQLQQQQQQQEQEQQKQQHERLFEAFGISPAAMAAAAQQQPPFITLPAPQASAVLS